MIARDTKPTDITPADTSRDTKPTTSGGGRLIRDLDRRERRAVFPGPRITGALAAAIEPVEGEEELIGVLGYLLRKKAIVAVVAIYVEEDHRRTGIATALLGVLIERFASRTITLAVEPRNTAVGLFRKAGFAYAGNNKGMLVMTRVPDTTGAITGVHRASGAENPL